MNKYISYAAQIIKGHLTRKSIPILVTLCVTNRCNLECIYCYKEDRKAEEREFSTQELLELIDLLAAMGTKYISLNGGEALLRDDIGIIVNRIRLKNMLCHLSTNGLLVKENISLLKKIDSLAISIDGYREGNDLNRGQGAYDRVIEGIECLNKNSIKFHTHTVLTKNNKDSVDEMLALCGKYGFSAQFSLLRPEDSPDKDIKLSDSQARAIIGRLINCKRRGFPVFFSYAAHKNMLRWPFSYDQQMIYQESGNGYRQRQCYIKRFSCHIEPSGLVYPCIVLVGKFKALNFLEAGFKKAWDNLSANQCRACYNICCNDLSFIFSLSPASLLNALKIVMERVRQDKI